MFAALPTSLVSPTPIVALALIAVLAALGRLLLGQHSLEALDDRLDRWLTCALVGATAFSWVGTILAVMGVFRAWLMAVLVGLVIVWRLVHHPRRTPSSNREVQRAAGPAATPTLVRIVVAALFISLAILLNHPAESLLVNGDPSAYTIAGVLLGRTGKLYYEPTWTPQLGYTEIRNLFHLSGTLQLTRHWMPFYQFTAGRPTVEIGFFPLTKVWLALGYWLMGSDRASIVTAVACLLSLAGLYALARRRSGWAGGLTAVLFLGLSLPQIWFARQATSEIYAQMAAIGGIYLAAIARDTARVDRLGGHRLWMWSGLALGALPLARFEGLAIAAILALGIILGHEPAGAPGPRTSRGKWLLLTAGSSALAIILSALSSQHYFANTLALLLTPARARWAAFVLISLTAIGLLYRRLGTRDALRRALAPHASYAFSTVIALAWAAWTVLTVKDLCLEPLASTLPGWLAQYLTVAGLILCCLGWLWLTRPGGPSRRPEILALGAAGVCFLFVFRQNHFVTPVHPWAMRRLLPVILPALALGAADLIHGRGFPHQTPARPPRALLAAIDRLVRVAASLALGIASLTISFPLLGHTELRGFWSQLTSSVADLPPSSLLILDNGSYSRGLSQPMELLLGFPSFAVPAESRSAGQALDALVDQAHADDKPVIFISSNGDLQWHPQNSRMEHLAAHSIEAPALRQRPDGPPRSEDIGQVQIRLDSYRVLPSDADTLSSPRRMVAQAGPGSYPFLRGGFYPMEGSPESGFVCWTDGEARIILPWPGSSQPLASFDLTLLVASGRPEGMACHTELSAEDRIVFQGQLPSGFGPQTIRVCVQALANSGSDDLEFTLRSDTWTPPGGETRRLGVLFHELDIQPVSQ